MDNVNMKFMTFCCLSYDSRYDNTVFFPEMKDQSSLTI